jgi:hypothetical protein
MFNPLLSLSPLASIEVEEVVCINRESDFKKKFELPKLTTQFIHSATRLQAHIFMTGEIHTESKGSLMSELVQKVCCKELPTNLCRGLINCRVAPINSRLARCSKPYTVCVVTACLS